MLLHAADAGAALAVGDACHIHAANGNSEMCIRDSYISRIFAPIESLGMEIQTIQSAMAVVKRIDAFLAQPERTIPAERRTAARGRCV